MNEKLSLQDLVEVLSKKADITKKEADLFFRELFQLILDRIFDNDSVKIKDFGTFKLTPVSSRESVDVNTGEKIEIPAHHRLSFSPDKMLKELVNKPFSQFETILLDEKGELESVGDIEDKTINTGNEQEVEVDEIDIEEAVVDEKEEIEEAVGNKSSIIEKEKEIKDVTSDNNTKVYSPSFSYTYTYTTKSQESDDTVILSVPKNNIIVPAEQVISKTDRIISKNEDDVAEKDNIAPKVEDKVEKREDIVVVEEISPKAIEPIEIIVEETVKPEVKEIIKPKVVEVKTSVNEDWSFDSEIEIEEDISPLPVSEDVTPSVENPVIEQGEKKKYSSLLDRPLIPVEDDIESDDSIIIDTVDDISEAKDSQHIVYNKPVESRGLVYTESLEEVDISSAYDYENPSLGARLKKRLPVIFFVLVIVAFAAYSFFKLFDVRYDFEDQLNRKNFRLEDSLVYLNERTGVVEDHLNDTDMEADSTVSHSETNKAISAVSAGLEAVSSDSLKSGLKGIGKSERIISERLHIGIVNKAMHHLHKYATSDTITVESTAEPSVIAVENNTPANNVIPNVQPVSSNGGAVVTMGRGTTLRTLSTKYYGNPAYWVYIYQANKSKLSNPNDIAVGMRITIPKLSDYGINNPKSPIEIEKAKALEAYY